ncbi:glycosyl hydrolase family 28-related protein [Chitinophaga alhagiae]|uniref:glycosyl hydrolase family 28-related protein n=1 Tax=Chitinophaga alhagiae TaxID=2203219 RepID=UPI000E5A7534|nr:glycosyl hydrolase family 28-related protein [Chitinophaga alhagiae]
MENALVPAAGNSSSPVKELLAAMWLCCLLLGTAGAIAQPGPVTVRLNGATADAAIHTAIQLAKKNGSREIYLPAGHYLVSKPVRLPSDFTLRASQEAYIELEKGCNQYLLQNEDLVNGNRNITVTGGKWNGNGWSQTRTIRNRVDNSAFCFGMFFYKVQRLEVASLQIDSTRSWGIAYMECDTVHIHDIHFQQNPFRDARHTSALNQNGDGVTGGGNHVLIENISGFTNDDLVAFASGGACFQGKMAPFPAYDYTGVTVRNIYPQNIYDSIPALKAVAFYTFEHTAVSNITIENVHGNTAAASVLFYSLFNKVGHFRNVRVSGISGANVYSRSTDPGQPRVYGIISVKNSVMDSVLFENISRVETQYPNPQFLFDSTTEIDRLTIRHVNIRHSGLPGNLLLHAPQAVIRNSSITAIKISPL